MVVGFQELSCFSSSVSTDHLAKNTRLHLNTANRAIYGAFDPYGVSKNTPESSIKNYSYLVISGKVTQLQLSKDLLTIPLWYVELLLNLFAIFVAALP